LSTIKASETTRVQAADFPIAAAKIVAARDDRRPVSDADIPENQVNFQFNFQRHSQFRQMRAVPLLSPF
jgi:hypothetical protein